MSPVVRISAPQKSMQKHLAILPVCLIIKMEINI